MPLYRTKEKGLSIYDHFYKRQISALVGNGQTYQASGVVTQFAKLEQLVYFFWILLTVTKRNNI